MPDTTGPWGLAERRQLTVVFVDLVGSTSLSQQLDPEDLSDVLSAYRMKCGGIVAASMGHVAQYLGDGILIYFGYPVAQEDGARRAVDAALRIVEAVGQIPMKAPIPSLKVRVGVDIGTVVIGAIGSGQPDEHLAWGAATNVATRLQAIAPPDTVLVSDATRRMIHGYFTCARLGDELERPHGVGKIYRIVTRTGASRSIDAAATVGLTRLVGRSAELAAIESRWSHAIDGNGSSVLLQGEPGIGKSRLVHGLKERVARGAAEIMEWDCAPDFRGMALRPVAEALARVFEIGPAEPARSALSKLERWVLRLALQSPDAIAVLASLLSITGAAPQSPEPAPQLLRRRTLDALVELVGAMSSQRGLLLIIEDLHWADPTTLELVDSLVQSAPSRRSLLVLTSRADYQPTWRGAPHVAAFLLERLQSPDVESMIGALTSGYQISKRLADQIAVRSEGVPLFVEQVTRALLESAADVRRERRDEHVESLDAPALPLSVHELLLARFDRVGDSKRVAQIASALGRTFDYRWMQAVWEEGEQALSGHMQALVRADLLQFAGEGSHESCRFRHALLRDVAYESLLRKPRRQLHVKIVGVLQRCFPEVAETQPALIAQHATRAGDADTAIRYWTAAGQQALARFANHEAVTCLSQGLLMTEGLEDSRARADAELSLRVLLGPALMAVRGYAHADVTSNYTRAHGLIGQVGESPQTFAVLWGLWAQHFVAGDIVAARGPAEQVTSIARAVNDRGLLPLAHNAIGFVECYSASYRETVALVDQGLAVFDLERERQNTLKFQFSSSLALINMGATALWMLGKPEQARQLAARSQPLADALAHPPSTAFALSSKAWLLQLAGEAKEVREVAKAVAELSGENGFELWPPLVGIFDGWAQLAEGDVSAGVETMRGNFEAYKRIGGGILRTHAFALLAAGLFADDRIDEAIATADDGIRLAKSSGQVHFEPELHRVKGLALARRAQALALPHDDARLSLEAARSLAQAQGARWLELRAAISLAEHYREQFRWGAARAILEPVYQSIEEGHAAPEMREAARLLEELDAFVRS